MTAENYKECIVLLTNGIKRSALAAKRGSGCKKKVYRTVEFLAEAVQKEAVNGDLDIVNWLVATQEGIATKNPDAAVSCLTGALIKAMYPEHGSYSDTRQPLLAS